MTQSKSTPKSAPAAGADSAGQATAADRLHAGARELTVPEPLAEAESMLLKVGLALPVLGLILIGVAWYSASGTANVAEQVPYLISGGIVGLALVLIGIGLFVRYSLTRLFRFWLARMLIEQQTQTDRVVEAIDNLETALRRSQVGK